MKADDSLVVAFASREAAGEELGRHLAALAILPEVVLGLPRGGVVVAAEVARILQRPLSVIVVRKIGHPRQREYAVGALAEHDILLLDQTAGEVVRIPSDELAKVIAEEKQRLLDYQNKFHSSAAPTLAGKNVVIIDDGLATGATAEAAVLSVRKQGARQITIATPVASPSAVNRLTAVADKVVALITDLEFAAVGQYYQRFPQTEDDEVLALLHSHA